MADEQGKRPRLATPSPGHQHGRAGEVSHELRKHLNIIIGFAELLLDEAPGTINQRQRQCLKDIRHAGQRLLNLVDGMTEPPEIEVAKKRWQPGDIDGQKDSRGR